MIAERLGSGQDDLIDHGFVRLWLNPGAMRTQGDIKSVIIKADQPDDTLKDILARMPSTVQKLTISFHNRKYKSLYDAALPAAYELYGAAARKRK
jgi:hypothetical protein